MKKIILITILLLTFLNTKEFELRNPNGDPFLLTLGITAYGVEATLPITNWLTLRAANINPFYTDVGESIYITTGINNGNCAYEASIAPCYNIESFNAQKIGSDIFSAREELHIPLNKIWK